MNETENKHYFIIFLVVMFFGGCNMQTDFLFPEPQWPTEQMLAHENMKLWQATASIIRV